MASESTPLRGDPQVNQARERADMALSFLVNSEKKELSSFLIWIVVALALIASIALVLVLDTGDCESPLRLWLMVTSGYSVVVTLLLIFMSFLVKRPDLRERIYESVLFRVLVAGLILCGVIWFIFGNIWLYSGSDCSSDFEGGYTLALLLVVLGYIGMSSLCLMSCFYILLGYLGLFRIRD